SGVQGCLPELVRPAVGAVTVPIAAKPSGVIVGVVVAVISVVIAGVIAASVPGAAFRVVSAFECLLVVTTIELAVAKAPIVVLGRVSVCAKIGVIGPPVSRNVVAAFLTSFIVPSV